MRPIFITGIGTDVGKTIASVIIVHALYADYWKPVQAGLDEETDSDFVRKMLKGSQSVVHPEIYRLKLAASPHIAAAKETINIELDQIESQLPSIDRFVVIEGAGGIMVPLNSNEFVIDLIAKLNAQVILVSRNYLGSINHSLLTAALCRQKKLDVLGWIFNGKYGDYEDQISGWTGLPIIGKIPDLPNITPAIFKDQSLMLKENLLRIIKQRG